MFWIRTLAVALVAAVAVSAEDKKPAEFDAKALLGTWKITEGSKAGEMTAADKIKDPAEFTADKITLKNPEATFEFSYKIDAKASPMTVDMEILAPEGFKGAKSKGILSLEGDTMKLVYNPSPEGDRPKEFKSTKENGMHMYVMKKAKKDDK